MSSNVLHVENVTMQFGGVVAVNNLSLDIPEGKIIALIGPNGAGKTTAFNCITGVYEPTNGLVEFMGEPIVRNHPQGKMKKNYKGENGDMYLGKVVANTPDKITSQGIARTFQNIRLWKSMTVFENVLIAKHMHAKQNVFSATFRGNAKEEKRMREETMELLREQGLDKYADEIATSLPYGLQRRLEIARALAADPKLLLLDEPAAGMNPQETLELAQFIREIREKHKLTVFIEAVKGISFDVPEGQIVTLIGANGAGKSSTLRAIAGLVKPSGGSIELKGENITGLDPTSIVKKGITLVPEGRKIFPDLTVVENLKIGAYLRNDDLTDDLNWVYDLFPRLKERSWQAGGTLSGGEQQMLAVGRALMSRPKVIMMDEPSLGLAPIIVRGIFDIIKEINKRGVTVLLIEQNANMALKTAHIGYVLETGRLTMSGSGEELLANEQIKAAYLGT